MPDFQTKHSTRARRLSVSVNPDKSVVVTVPARMVGRPRTESIIERFVRQHARWIEKQLEYFSGRKGGHLAMFGRREYKRYKEVARAVIRARLDYFASIYSLTYKRVSIRDTKSRWGSCSEHGNLNFSYKLLFLPPELRDYIIVHELCHLKELNHSKAFWDLVAQATPNHKQLRKELALYC